MTDTTVSTAAAAGGATKKRDRVAQHSYLDDEGNKVEAEEAATGYSYEMEGEGDEPLEFSWYWKDANEIERRMLAIFGAKTLATNESSQLRNNEKKKGTDEASPENQMEAVKARFALMRQDIPQWVDRSREGAAVKVDKNALAGAICDILVKDKKKTQQEIDESHFVKVLQKLEEDPAFVRKARQVPAVNEAYAKRIGRTTATVDDFADL
jgi:hypothetical protein